MTTERTDECAGAAPDFAAGESKRADKGRLQYAALPVRMTASGTLQVMLLTSRGTRRWIIPKGWPMHKLTPAAAAAREAYEEAGLQGTIGRTEPIGWYAYDKGRANGPPIRLHVGVFIFWVATQLPSWPEQRQRDTSWFDPSEAAGLVAEPDLAAILRALPVFLRADGG